jgi:murein DD-endopeptidase MepM/ murein hydrolase activator NlpD
VFRGQKPVTTTASVLEGTIASSLWQSMVDAGGKPALISALSDIFAWSVDLHYLRAGDSYKVLYEEEYIDGRFIGVGRILAAQIRQGDETHDAFYFEDNACSGYFDRVGNSLDRAFLKAPVRYSRISSRFSRHRLHPVLKTVKPHLGTDYAAPVGTPVMSTADGTVVAASYDPSNGKYVKIRHTGTYTTQYLHLSRFAEGIRSGKPVKQGDIIGAVGATGMATGPHLCYRFWKNGRQIDPLTAPMPSSRQLNAEQMKPFAASVTQYIAILNNPSENLTLARQN